MSMSLTIPARIVFLSMVLSLLLIALNLRGADVGFTFALGNGFNLQIDSHALYNDVLVPGSTWELKNLVPHADHFFDLDDVKPGDHGEATISLHTNADAWICLDFENFKDEENGENEPESHEDISGGLNDGELAEGLEFFAWYDDGDDLFEKGETPIFGTSTQSATLTLKDKSYTLADSKYGTKYPAGTTKYIGITWCAGNLTVDLINGGTSCDGTVLGNIAQTDSMEVDISFRAVPSSDNTDFLCNGGNTKRNNGHGNNDDDIDCSNPGRGPKNGIEGPCGDDDENEQGENGGGNHFKEYPELFPPKPGKKP